MSNECALITGGSGDLAEELSSVLFSRGLKVYRPSSAELDVTRAGSVADYFAELDDLDLLVCNAGKIEDALLLKMSEESWDGVMDVNLKGAYLTAKQAIKKMLSRGRVRAGGHIVFISSYSAFHPPMGQANYAAAKAGLIGLAKSMAKELGGRNIRVNVIVPGFLETKMTKDSSNEAKENSRNKHSLGRFNDTSSVAKFITMLHLEMKHTSGQVFHLDSRPI